MNARAYFKSHFKQNLRPIIIISAVCLTLSLVIGFSVFAEHYSRDWLVIPPPPPNLNIPVAILCLLCFVAPILEFSTFKQRRNLDCWYSLPISKRALSAVHLTAGYLAVIIPFTVCYIGHLILLLTNGVLLSNVIAVLPHYVICLLSGFCMYSIYVFLFNRANSLADSIITMALWPFAIFAFLVGIQIAFLGWGFDTSLLLNSLIFMPITILTNAFEYVLQNEPLMNYLVQYSENAVNVICGAIWGLLGVASAIYNVRFFGHQRAEKTQEQSSSLLCYPTLIPIYTVSGILMFPGPIMCTIILAISFIGYLIYRRGFHLKRADIISLAALLAFSIIYFTVIIPMT